MKAFLDKNLGDDMMLLALFRFFPKDDFTLSCTNSYEPYYRHLFADCMNVSLTEIALCQIARLGDGGFDIILQIGGSILQGTRNIGCFYRGRNIRAILRQKRYGTKYYIIGCNTGPFTNRLTRFFVQLEIKSCDGISVRDHASYQFIQNGFTRDVPIIQADDLVLEYAARYGNGCRDGALGISVMIPSGMSAAAAGIIHAYADICNQYIQKTHRKVKLLCYNSGTQDDVSAAKAVLAQCQFPESVRIAAYEDGNYEEIIQETSLCDRIVAVRFHSMIMAFGTGVPIWPVAYSNKMQNVLEDMGQNGCSITMAEFAKGSYKKLLDDILNDRNFVCRTIESKNSIRHLEFIKELQNCKA